MNKIDSFKDEYFFLSNFYPCKIFYDGLIYTSVESAYQSSKTLSPIIRKDFINLSPSEAKLKGRKISLRPNFDNIKYNIMYELVSFKFVSNPELSKKLLETKDTIIIEGNYWNDTYWGVCDNTGKNNLGIILMQVRENLKIINKIA